MELLILGQASERPPTDVVLTFPLSSALGLTDLPAELSGHGPITAETARELMQDATVRRLLTDPISGTMIDLGRTRYRPTTALDRILNHRDRTCSFPGCKPALRCDKDHSRPYHQGGSTSTDNMLTLCRRHHNLKTRKSWRYDVNPDGSVTWTSAAGFSYTKPAHRYPLEPDEPPDQDHLPDEPDDILLQSDPDPPRADDPLPEAPTITLEEFFEYGDQLDRWAILAANRDYDAWLAFRRARDAEGEPAVTAGCSA
jgi:hypothetical protein